MWLATKLGFYSIVQKLPGEFHVRARVKKDLENLRRACCADWKLHTSPEADYRYRLVIGAEDVTHILLALGSGIDYSNFKSKIGDTPDQRAKLHAYHNIWGEMYQIQR